MQVAAERVYLGLVAPRVEGGENLKDVVAQDRERLEKQEGVTEESKNFRELVLDGVEVHIKAETLRKEDAERI